MMAGEAPPRLESGPREPGRLGKGPGPGLEPAPVGATMGFPRAPGSRSAERAATATAHTRAPPVLETPAEGGVGMGGKSANGQA